MAGYARYTALLDACVLFPVAVCDSLMSVAVTGLYAPKWTRRIEDEWTRSLEEKHGKPPGTYAARRDAMRDAAPDWEVPEPSWTQIAGCLRLPDPDDVHVLAAAIAGHADCIVTANLKDFPEQALAPFGIQAIHPDEFLIAQMDLDPLLVLAAFKEQRERLKNPAYTPLAFADALERNALILTAQRLREAAALI
ncbi:MAG: PIN domain-containing protein [Vitreoscilla sp.]|nr:PIN domain-containing protein [Vitreoscilla sp.]